MAKYSAISSSLKYAKVLKLFGFASFSVNETNQKVETKFKDIIAMLINLTVGCIVFYTSMDYASGSKVKNALLINLGTFLTMNLCILIGMISMITCFVVRHKMYDIVRTFEEVDSIVSFHTINNNFLN